MAKKSRKRSSEGSHGAQEDEAPPASPPQASSKKKSRTNDDDDENNDSNVISSPLRQINRPGKPPEAGVIKKVYVENFMCHRKLTVDLCRNVNFIHGQNGSGKSAILAAVQICLGAGARRTHRARNLKELVRKEGDCTGAKVRVTLLNGGQDGFQQDIYGDTITVERSISKAGGYNGYKLLDDQGKEQSRAKKDLDAMLDQLNIQVENPVAVLDQEESKKFLTGKPQDKYSFFMKATELERLNRTYCSIMDKIAELETTKDKVTQGMAGAVENVKQLKRESDQFQELEKLEDIVQSHRIDFTWAMYTAADEKVRQMQENIKLLELKLEKRQKELESAEKASVSSNDEEQQKKDRMSELTEEASEAAASKTDLEAELKRAMAPVKAKERELSNLAREQGKATKRLHSAKQYLEETRSQIMAAAGSAKSEEASRTQRLQQAERELEEARAESPQIRQRVSESHRMYEDMGPHVDQAKSNKDSLAGQVSAVNHKIRELQSSENSSLAMFGNKCVKVHQLVERARQTKRFTGNVVGPIGAHIKIAPGKEQYAPIAELAIGGGTLDRFIVTTDADRKVLMQIRRDAGCRSHDCGIFQLSDGARYRVPPPPVAGVETVASVLQVSDDLVFNCLVDNCRIDQVALAESKEASERALLVEDANHKYSIRGGQIRSVYFLPQGDYWTVKKGARSIISTERELRQTIGVDRSHAISQAQREVAELQKDLEDCRAKEADLKSKLKDYKIKWNHENRAQRDNSKRIETLMRTIEEVKEEADAAEENVALDTTELEEDVSNAEQTVEAIKQQADDLKQEIEEMGPQVDELQKQLDEVATRNEKVLADLDAAEQELNEYYQSLSQRQALVDKKKEKAAKIKESIQAHQAKLEELSEDRSEFLRKARVFVYRRERAEKKKAEMDDETMTLSSSQSEASDEPTDEALELIEPKLTRREPSYYKIRIERAKQKIVKEKERRRLTDTDPEVALGRYLRAKRDLEAKTDQIDSIEDNLELMKGDMSQRQKRWKQFRKHIEHMTGNTFDEMLQKKGSSGALEFDHEESTLDLNVQKDNKNEMSQTKDVKALSGGERSYTTLSLLLALGEHLETPFRVMDEFDVFMDPVARKIALNTLVEIAKEMQHRQFIFITPQDLSSLKPDPMLKIFKMKPPARNPNVGGPSQQTLDFGSQESH